MHTILDKINKNGQTNGGIDVQKEKQTYGQKYVQLGG